MKFLKAFFIFLVLNFGALGLGILFMGDGTNSDWYLSLQKAPWTPEGWVFGAAWTTVMFCFSFYMAFLIIERTTTKVVLLFLIQFILNSTWNFAFFNQRLTDVALGIISLLTVVIIAFFVTYLNDLKWKSLFILPYLIWICIATSLNLYISINN